MTLPSPQKAGGRVLVVVEVVDVEVDTVVDVVELVDVVVGGRVVVVVELVDVDVDTVVVVEELVEVVVLDVEVVGGGQVQSARQASGHAASSAPSHCSPG